MKRIVSLLICLLLFVSSACAQTVDDYSFAQDRIWEMEDKYGVQILIGPEATVLYTDYDVMVGEAAFELSRLHKMLGYELNPEEEVFSMLDMLDEALGSYPAGFFDLFDPSLQICLVGDIFLRSGEGSYAGLSDIFSAEPRLYINVQALPRTFHHELWHMIEDRADLSFEDWNSLNPEGFQYTDDSDIKYTYDDEWFYWYYSATGPAEDRATVFEALFMEDADWWEAHPHIRKKLDVMLDSIGMEKIFLETGQPE